MVERKIEDQTISPEAQAFLAKNIAGHAEESGDYDKFNLAGNHYEQAYLLFPQEEEGKKIAAAISSIVCFKRADSLKDVLRVGTDLLNKYSSGISVTEKAELSDLLYLTRIRLGQEE